MSLAEQYFDSEDLHPIDIVESLAEHHAWEFDRVADDQIAMAVEGQWRTYSITLAWSGYDQTLRLICTFEMEPPENRLPQIYEVLNATNDHCWAGAFTFWQAQRLMVYRYGLVLAGGHLAGPEQIDTMIRMAVSSAERFYPAFQLVAWGDRAPEDAMKMAMTEAYGRA
ncbi:YbjN domain-containing protein [Oceaniglobus ichthyenteri]|uniref:YbjN domain-containing protein n=1 Tax=Oceaniglobus ichthyenteri TaxID=2136177 RepID=UPI000D37E41B|nr:YbjN domain-containing protein [Oceaniglobus ichthyenteri]